MKKIRHFINLFLFFTALLLATNCANTPEQYAITGHVKGVDSTWVLLKEASVFGAEGETVLDSVYIENGVFAFHGTVAHVDRVQLVIGDQYQGDFFLENSSITIEVDLGQADQYGRITPVVRGAAYDDQFNAQEEKAQGIFYQEKYAILDEIREEAIAAYRAEDEALIKKVQDKQAAYQDLMDERREAYKQSKLQFVQQNPSSPIAPYVLGAHYSEGRMSMDEMKAYYEIFQGAATQTTFFKKYIEKTYNEVFVSLGVGATAPDFTLATMNGEAFTLSDVAATYIFVDFWASWCVPCREAVPHLKGLEEKYKEEGFEIVAVCTADEEAKCRTAIEEDQIATWYNVYDAAGPEEQRALAYGNVAKTYAIPFLPTTFLLDANLEIVGRNLEKEALDAVLVERFGY